MTHVLAIYTVIYIAILFTTVGIWAGEIAKAEGDFILLLSALGAFSLKLAIDDYLHFSKLKKGIQKSLLFSLGMYLMIAASIANAALAKPVLAPALAAGVFVLGIVWLLTGEPQTHVDADEQRKAEKRHKGWLKLNGISVGLLGICACLQLKAHFSWASAFLAALIVLVIYDFFKYETLGRLAEAAEKEQAADKPPAEATPQTPVPVQPEVSSMATTPASSFLPVHLAAAGAYVIGAGVFCWAHWHGGYALTEKWIALALVVGPAAYYPAVYFILKWMPKRGHEYTQHLAGIWGPLWGALAGVWAYLLAGGTH
ncbi:MAG TPA: hypothetical protein VMF52_20655 [Steroidobacteraceae bacterium]|nr:hypothetical protein [Steroidobacteraceae bacterium]